MKIVTRLAEWMIGFIQETEHVHPLLDKSSFTVQQSLLSEVVQFLNKTVFAVGAVVDKAFGAER